MQRYLYPSETQRSGFARERRSNEVIRSFRRKAETERAQFAPTRRWLSSSGCRGGNICFSKPAEKRRRKARGYGALCAMPVRPPGIFASARRKGTRFASAAHRA